MLHLGILGSTRGTMMLSLIEAIHSKELNAEIAIVLSNKSDAIILQRAEQHHLPHQFVDANGFTREAYDQLLSQLLQKNQVDLVLLIGYMRILSKPFIDAWQNRILNVHPSLLPDFAGKMNEQVHQAVLMEKRKETGCTVHFVTEEVDAGPIVLQKKCPVFSDDSVETLKTRVQALEGNALVEAIKGISSLRAQRFLLGAAIQQDRHG